MEGISGVPRALYGFSLEIASSGISSDQCMGSRREILVRPQGSDAKLKSGMFDLV